MKKLLILCATLFFAGALSAQIPYQYYSPLNAVPGGPSGPATNMLDVEPYCCPSAAIEISAAGAVTDDDLQWVHIPLNGVNAGLLKEVTVCYQVLGEGNSYISQVRLTEMTTPNQAMVKMDDGANLTSKEPACYTAKANFKVEGTITLALRIVLAPGDKVIVGGVTVRH